MKKILSTIIMLFCINACNGDYVVPTFLYKAPFDPLSVDKVEVFMRDISARWNLELFEKDREAMKIMTQGQEAFFIALYFEGDAILAIMNAGVGNVLTLSLQDHGNLPVEELERLANEVRSGLKTQLNINLVAADP